MSAMLDGKLYSEESLKQMLTDLHHAKAALRCIYGHATSDDADAFGRLEFIEETCCTVLSEAERIFALCEHDEAGA